MKTLTKYIAYDGKEFDKFDDCRRYEDNVLKSYPAINEVKFYDENGAQVKLKDVRNSLFSTVHKVVINSQDQYDAFRKYKAIDEWCGGANDIIGVGTWKYIEDVDAFINLDEVLEEYVGHVKWERDEAFHMLNNMHIPFCHVHKDITDRVKNEEIALVTLYTLVENGDVRIIQIGGLGK